MSKLELDIFKSGNYGEKGEWSEDDIQKIADDYNPSLHEAPVTIDHAKTGPSLGWVESLKRVGSNLYATLKNINPSLLELIKSGALKKRSVELYRSFKETGRPYLRALTFLGAQIPEVKSLNDPLFNDSEDNCQTFDFESADNTENQKDINSIPEDNNIGNEAPIPPDSQTVEMAEIIRQKEESDKEIRKLKARIRKNDVLHFCESLMHKGKIIPAFMDAGLVDFIISIDDVPEISFSEDKKIKPSEWFLSFLENLPRSITFSEIAGQSKPPEQIQENIFISNRSDKIKPESIDLHNQALEFMGRNPSVSYSEALIKAAKKQKH